MTRLAHISVRLASVLFLPIASAAQEVPRFERAECPALRGLFANPVRVECGYLTVHRSREQPAAGTFKLAVAIVHPTVPSEGPALVLPHGGPSGPGGLRGPELSTAARWAPLLKRDIIVYDLRGAGFSGPELCPRPRATSGTARNLPIDELRAAWIRAAKSCAADLRAKGLDPASFSTVANADDLIDLRKTLGHGTWDVFGVSYGSRIAQEVMRRDPRGVRSVVLSAPVIPGPSQVAESVLNFQRVLDHVFESCAAQSLCAQAFPTLAQDFAALFDELNAKPIDITLQTATGTASVRFDGDRMLRALRQRFSARIARVPLYINEMLRGDRARAARLLSASDAVAAGNNTLTDLVACFESGGPTPYKDAITAVRAQIRPIFQVFVNDDVDSCPFLQERFAQANDRAFVSSDIPTLIITQEFDDRTPTEFGRRISEHLTTSYLFEVRGAVHGQSNACTQSIIFAFMANPALKPAASCLDSLPALMFDTKRLEP